MRLSLSFISCRVSSGGGSSRLGFTRKSIKIYQVCIAITLLLHFSSVYALLPPSNGRLVYDINDDIPSVSATYLPLSYNIPVGGEECLLERITEPEEFLTASVFVISGEELQAAMVLEGPVAPVDLDLNEQKRGMSRAGSELGKYLTRYAKEGTTMFIKGKFGASMMNVKPIRFTQLIDFENESEDYYDDYNMNDKQREEFNKHHDLEHQHRMMEHPPPPHVAPPLHKHGEEHAGHEHRERYMEEHNGHLPPGHAENESEDEEEEYYDDDYVKAREEMRKEQLEEEAEVDDDFVKLQMDHERHALPEMDGEGPRRRRINNDEHNGNRGGGRDSHLHNQQHGRRLTEDNIKLIAGEPYQKTIQISSPGWYRLCVHPKSHPIQVEMELRKSSTYGDIDRRTGHVPELVGVETHSEIHSLYEKEDDEVILAEEGAIKDEDLHTTKEQLRILEKVYADIISKQLEERRVWNWRTIKNQHLHSHLVLGNLVETLVYMCITGWQVYTIRKWFGGGPALG